MSEADRRLAEHVAQTVVARVLDVVQDKATAAKIMDVWGGEIDKTLGRGLRRLLFYVVILVGGVAAAKLGVMDKLGGFLFGKV